VIQLAIDNFLLSSEDYMKIQNITDMIGNTPLLRVNDKIEYYAKIEGNNLFGSVKTGQQDI
ncbi:MAG: hypothetical protein K2O91_15690, partial [Lachnospiraceae bacterium]|nr:hypothetical protein [Lachnospiraceae bacterium]